MPVISVTRVDPGDTYTIPEGADFLVYAQSCRYASDSTSPVTAVSLGGNAFSRGIDHNGGESFRMSSLWLMPQASFPEGAGPHAMAVTHPDTFQDDPAGWIIAASGIDQADPLLDVTAGGMERQGGLTGLLMGEGAGTGVGTITTPIAGTITEDLTVAAGGLVITTMLRRGTNDRNEVPAPSGFTVPVDQVDVDAANRFVAYREEAADATIQPNWTFDLTVSSASNNASAAWVSLRPAAVSSENPGIQSPTLKEPNQSDQDVADASNVTVRVWHGATISGAPDETLSDQSITNGVLEFEVSASVDDAISYQARWTVTVGEETEDRFFEVLNATAIDLDA